VIKFLSAHLDKRHDFTKNEIDIEKSKHDAVNGKETVQLQAV
jgi:hypothetical protein